MCLVVHYVGWCNEQCGVRTSYQHHDIITAGVHHDGEHLLMMYAGTMAEGGSDPRVQSDPEDMETDESPLDTMGSMTQSLTEEPQKQKQRGSRAGKKAYRRISKRQGAQEFLEKYEERVQAANNDNTPPEQPLEAPKKMARIEPWLPSPGEGRGRLIRFLRQRVPHEWDHGDGEPVCSATYDPEIQISTDRATLLRCLITLPISSETRPGRPVLTVAPTPRQPPAPDSPVSRSPSPPMWWDQSRSPSPPMWWDQPPGPRPPLIDWDAILPERALRRANLEPVNYIPAGMESSLRNMPRNPRPRNPRPQNPGPQNPRPQNPRSQNPRPQNLRPPNFRPLNPRPPNERPPNFRPQNPRPPNQRQPNFRPPSQRPPQPRQQNPDDMWRLPPPRTLPNRRPPNPNNQGPHEERWG